MKKKYQSPATDIFELTSCAMLCGSVKGSVDDDSISQETTEDLVKRNATPSNSVKWDEWE